MTKPLQITLPLDAKIAISLRVGDEVMLTGPVFTGRDQACARLFRMIQDGDKLPFDLAGQVLYFVGPSPAAPGMVIGSAGPTTSGRMNPFMPALLVAGLRGFIGKGYINQTTKQSLEEHQAIYFGAIGGTGALLSRCIESSEIVAFPELLSEAVRQLALKNFPVVVLHDTHGSDLYENAMKDLT